MTTDTFPLPSTYAYGKVVGRIIYAIGDTAEDADDKPQARAAAGTVTFTPMATGAKVTTADYTAIIMNGAVKASLSSSGRILDAEGRQGIWLIQGIYRVDFSFTATSDGLRGSLPPFQIEVLPAHTDLAPLDLASAAPASMPEGAVVQTIVLPTGSGIMSRNAVSGEIEYLDPDDLGGTTTVDGLTDATTVGKAVAKAADAAAARAAISAQVAGSYATSAQGAKADTAVQPAGLTKSAVGLGSVDNTADSAKPVSTAQAAADAAVAAAAVQKASNLADLASAATARTNLGLGNSATRAVGTTAGTVAAGDDPRITNATQIAVDPSTVSGLADGTLIAYTS